MKLIRTLFLLALACGDPATVVEQPQAQGESGTALPPAPGLEDAAPPVAYDPPPPVAQPDAGPAPVDEPDAAPTVVVAEPDAGVEPPVLIPGSSNVFCACMFITVQSAECEPPTVTCQRNGTIDQNATFTEQLDFATLANDLELTYSDVQSGVTTELQDVCPVEQVFTFVDPIPADGSFEGPSQTICFVSGDFACTVSQTLTRGCV